MNNERPELSVNNQYYIPKHKYYELKHFCLQYPDWKKQRIILLNSICISQNSTDSIRTVKFSDRTCDTATKLMDYDCKIKLIEDTSLRCSEDLNNYILKAVTEGLSYNNLKTYYGIPCCKDVYFEMYHRFYYLLSKER